jgi:hypothetical protein
MAMAFILRYQEHCPSGVEFAGPLGTATATKIRSEQPDNDPHEASNYALPRGLDGQVASGDGSAFSGWQFAIETATKTNTFVRIESPDNDRNTAEHRIIPRCSS